MVSKQTPLILSDGGAIVTYSYLLLPIPITALAMPLILNKFPAFCSQ